MKDITLDEARKIASTCVIEAKVDGSQHTWNGTGLISARNIDRSVDRFPHIADELKSLDMQCVGEVAVPFGNVLTLNQRDNWAKARYYVFDILELQGKDWRQAPALDVRKKLAEMFDRRKVSFHSLRIPFGWKDFDKAWDYVTANKQEGLVLKPSGSRGKEFKLKFLLESKLPIIGFKQGSQKGAFLVQADNGETSKVSALSVDFIARYNEMLSKGEKPYAEIEYPFLTERGIPFQPRLRRLGTLSYLQVT